MRVARSLALACAAWFLSACASSRPGAVDPEAAYGKREALVSQWLAWGFTGRLSVDDGEEGGSGTIAWNVRESSSQLDFRGALGRGSWRLTRSPELAELALANGDIMQAATIDELLAMELGWDIPVDALEFWVRGLRAPGAVGDSTLDERGRLQALRQHGWTIAFERYGVTDGVDLPRRVRATRSPVRIKILMGDWQLPGALNNDS